MEFSGYMPLLVVAAFLISLVCSTVGVSGAFLLLPVQVLVLGSTSPSISSTNQLFNIVATPAGILRFIREGRMLWPLALLLCAGTLPGLFLGLYLRTSVLAGARAFTIFAAAVLLFTGFSMLRGRKKGGAQARKDDMTLEFIACTRQKLAFVFGGVKYSCSTPGLLFLSLGVGVVGGAYGIGGGSIMAPFLVSLFNLPVHALSAATLFSTFMTAVASTLGSLALHAHDPALDILPNVSVALALGVGGMMGMYCGARLQRFLSSHILRKLLFVLVLAAASLLVLRVF